MKNLAKLAFAFLLCGTVAPAAEITITPLPGLLNPSDMFDVYLGVNPAGAEIFAFSIDLLFTDDLTAGTPEELGFFANNGVFFSYFPGTGMLTAISDAASGPAGLLTEELVVRIPFTFLGATQTPTAVWIEPGTSYLLDASFLDVPFTLGTAQPPPAVPEPATFGLAGAAIIAVLVIRQRRRV